MVVTKSELTDALMFMLMAWESDSAYRDYVGVGHDVAFPCLTDGTVFSVADARKVYDRAMNPKRGRPRIHPDRKAYKAEKERERRARVKAQKESGK